MVLLPGPISEESFLCSEASELIPLPRTILSYPAGIRHTAASDYVFGMPTSQPGVYEHRALASIGMLPALLLLFNVPSQKTKQGFSTGAAGALTVDIRD